MVTASKIMSLCNQGNAVAQRSVELHKIPIYNASFVINLFTAVNVRHYIMLCHTCKVIKVQYFKSYNSQCDNYLRRTNYKHNATNGMETLILH